MWSTAEPEQHDDSDADGDDTRDTEGVYFRRWRNIRTLPAAGYRRRYDASRSTDVLPQDLQLKK